MIRAWRRADGKYRLDFGTTKYSEVVGTRVQIIGAGGRLVGAWVVPEDGLAPLGAEKMYGVLAGPSSCGCEPLGFRWVTESEVKAGQTTMKPCHDCAMRRFHPPGGPFAYVRHQCDIIDVCGEADFAEAVYAAEFAHRVGAIT